MSTMRVRFVVRGQVQGVGFRPFVYGLAGRYGLSGMVRNSPRGVIVEVQGGSGAVAQFARDLERELPPLARITSLEREELPPLKDESGFRIAQSTAGSAHAVLISPDTCTCAACLAEIADQEDRRFRYPFTNCTNCGPRYTITRSIPYDRPGTSMACFAMCPECQAEYENPENRRFHAQPNACPVCGPRVWLLRNGAEGSGLPDDAPQSAALESARQASPGRPAPEIAGSGGVPPLAAGGNHTPGPLPHEFSLTGDAALRALAELLLAGGIAAIKGLGGFHLACDACDEAAVARLRERKHRPHKPFAVMAADADEARRFAGISAEEEALLLSPERPIVICRLRREQPLAPGISPDTSNVGLMLPYTPLHSVLFAHLRELLRASASPRPAVLVMTSGNPGGEPICLGNREALARLGGMADAFLLHDRDILLRVDDSVVRCLPGRGPLFYRRARGYVPRPLPLGEEDTAAGKDPALPCVLGAGAELKNTLCLTKDGDAFVSQHIGDMDNLESAAFHGEIRDHLADLLRVSPALAVRDRHPDYLSSRMAEEYAAERGIPLLALQHHAAHACAVLAENAFHGRALVLALDGTGLGDDGTLWGGEALLLDSAGPTAPACERLGHFAPMDLPGGETAIREPWRIAQALLLRLGPGGPHASFTPPWLPEYAQAAAVIPLMLERRLNTPLSSSCGRLFDAVSALLGLCPATSYEGQAAIRLEEAQNTPRPWDHPEERLYPCPSAHDPDTGLLILDTHALFAAVLQDITAGEAVPRMARRFHQSLALGLANMAAQLAKTHGLRHIGLSGGCLQNVTLNLLLLQNLEERGLIPLSHKTLPPGDGCISLGQAAWGRMAMRAGRENEEKAE